MTTCEAFVLQKPGPETRSPWKQYVQQAPTEAGRLSRVGEGPAPSAGGYDSSVEGYLEYSAFLKTGNNDSGIFHKFY